MIIPSLHLHTEYSLLESSIKLDSLFEFAIEKGLKELVITDRNTMAGVGRFLELARKNKIKPVIGIDIDVDDFRIILIARNYDGYIELMRLASKVVKKEISLNEINFSDLFTIDHPTEGHFAKKERVLKIENYFVGTEKDGFGNSVYMKETKILHKEENKTLGMLAAIKNGGNKVETTFNYEPYVYEIEDGTSNVEQIAKIIEETNIVFPSNLNPVPKYEVAKGKTNISFLKELLNDGANNLLKKVDNREEYVERIKFELDIIEKLGFVDYFLIVWDLIEWSRKNDIVIGPGRGSSAGSLISYLLNITQIDPLKYGLLFERFLNPNRKTMPDIDIDIQDNRREEVIEYLFDKYGNDHVALISTFQKMGAKMAIRDAGRYLQIPSRDVDRVSKAIIINSTLREAYKNSVRFRAIIDRSTINTSLYEHAILIEGILRQPGTHAAGIVISDIEVRKKVPVSIGTTGRNQTQYSMNHLEEYGLLKIDLLGLRNLKILKLIQGEIYKNHKKHVDLTRIPFEDKDVNKLLSNADTNGIFQLESPGMKKTLVQVGISSFDDLVAIISLFRPGPMENIPLYAKRKNENLPIEPVSPEYDKIVKPTYGIIVYQEQIMQIAQKFAGMSFANADILRRAMGKKKIELINSMKNEFVAGATKNGHPIEKIETIYTLIEKFANYGFNKSHAVSYSYLSYWLAFLKVKFPFEFYTSLLIASSGSQTSIQKYVLEAKRKKIEVIGPNVNLSELNTVNKDKKIILPLTIAKGFGGSANQKLINEREANGEFIDFFDFVSRAKLCGLGESAINTLINLNSLRDFGNVQTLSDAVISAMRYADMITTTVDGKKTIDTTIIAKPLLVKQERELLQEIFEEKKLLGFQLSAFATTNHELKDKISDITVGTSKVVVAIVEKIKVISDKNGNDMAFVTMSDSTSTIDVMIFANTWKFLLNVKPGQFVKATIASKEYNNRKSYTLSTRWEEIENG